MIDSGDDAPANVAGARVCDRPGACVDLGNGDRRPPCSAQHRMDVRVKGAWNPGRASERQHVTEDASAAKGPCPGVCSRAVQNLGGCSRRRRTGPRSISASRAPPSRSHPVGSKPWEGKSCGVPRVWQISKKRPQTRWILEGALPSHGKGHLSMPVPPVIQKPRKSLICGSFSFARGR